jgi:hypothetical protein
MQNFLVDHPGKIVAEGTRKIMKPAIKPRDEAALPGTGIFLPRRYRQETIANPAT